MKRRHFIKHTLAGAALSSIGASLRTNLLGESEPKDVLRLAGTKPTLPTFYRRMFPELPAVTHTEDGLRMLGEAMVDEDEPVSRESEPHLPPAGYTYLGQFIDHDLTFDLTPLSSAGKFEIEDIRNFRTPFLDLDHVYAGGPNLSPFIYEKGNRNAERLLLGNTCPCGMEASPDDLPRNPQGIALVGDPRQDENLVIGQLHVAFLKLHNAIVARGNLDDYRRDGESDFVAAQRVVRWHYQWIVRHDYLNHILHPSVFEQLGDIENELCKNPPAHFQIPVEFSAATFRFGHSMVRDVYKTGVNKKNGHFVELRDLLQQTGLKGGANPALPAEWVVCWERFFINRGFLNRSRKIDTQIANELHHLDEPSSGNDASPIRAFSVQLPRERLEPSLPIRTLLRGFRMKLPSGEKVADKIAKAKPKLGIKRLSEKEILGERHKHILENPEYGFRGNTPLWYYILKEAEVTEVDRDGKNRTGTCLGPLGSYIVAEVIINALAADNDSYFYSDIRRPAGPSDPNRWQPTLIQPNRKRDAMGDLLRFVFPGQMNDPRCGRTAN